MTTIISNDVEMGVSNTVTPAPATVGPPIPTTIMNVPLTTNLMSDGTKVPELSSSKLNGSPNSVEVEGPTSTTSVVPKQRKMVAVRYFLDRPGYGLHNSAVRFWLDPPSICVPSDIHHFLLSNGIIPGLDDVNESGGISEGISASLHDGSYGSLHMNEFLVEIFLDQFHSFMLLQACEDSKLEWNLSNSTIQSPSTFNIRLTDLHFHTPDGATTTHHGGGTTTSKVSGVGAPIMANTAPVGLFSFAFMVGLETLFAMERLIKDPTSDNSTFFFGVDPAYVITWGPYMIFSGGGLMWITGILQVFRNNIYGAVAFLVFGSFWFANGTKVILETHFSGEGTRAYEYHQTDTFHDPWGTMIRLLYIMAFVMVLLGSTFAGSKVSTILMSLLICKFLCQIGAAWSDVSGWMQVFFGWLVSWLAFYVFVIEMTNNVYHREVFELHKWSEEHSPGEIFAQPGTTHHTLYSNAQRKVKHTVSNITKVRMAFQRSASSVLHHGKKTD